MDGPVIPIRDNPLVRVLLQAIFLAGPVKPD